MQQPRPDIAMSLVVYAEASHEENPGHMVVGEETTIEPARYYGFRFDPASLPMEFRPPARWKDYLLTHEILGLIVDESRYVRHLFDAVERRFLEKRASIGVRIESEIPPRERWGSHGHYSFNPDDFHSNEKPCYNCVTWATEIANRMIAGFLPRVRQGRITLILEHLSLPRTES